MKNCTINIHISQRRVINTGFWLRRHFEEIPDLTIGASVGIGIKHFGDVVGIYYNFDIKPEPTIIIYLKDLELNDKEYELFVSELEKYPEWKKE